MGRVVEKQVGTVCVCVCVCGKAFCMPRGSERLCVCTIESERKRDVKVESREGEEKEMGLRVRRTYLKRRRRNCECVSGWL